jgi:intracellular septation protein
MFVATGVAIAATFAQIAWLKFRRRKVETMMWVSLAIIVVFGGATLLLHDETFIKWKPTILYWVFSVILGGAPLVAKKNLIRAVLGEQMQLPALVWTRLNLAWAGFFAFLGMANLWVAFYVPRAWNLTDQEANDIWVNFKLFGGMGLMVAFVILQALYLARHIQEKEPS